MDNNRVPQAPRVPLPDCNVPERNAGEPESLAWIASAVQATTVAEMHDIARDAQARGHWTERDAAWCRALRDHLAAVDHAAMNLLVAALGTEQQ